MYRLHSHPFDEALVPGGAPPNRMRSLEEEPHPTEWASQKEGNGQGDGSTHLYATVWRLICLNYTGHPNFINEAEYQELVDAHMFKSMAADKFSCCSWHFQ